MRDSCVAREWVQQTFTHDRRAVDTVTALMLDSREAVVDYMTPLGLHHLMGTGHHHGHRPVGGERSAAQRSRPRDAVQRSAHIGRVGQLHPCAT